MAQMELWNSNTAWPHQNASDQVQLPYKTFLRKEVCVLRVWLKTFFHKRDMSILKVMYTTVYEAALLITTKFRRLNGVILSVEKIWDHEKMFFTIQQSVIQNVSMLITPENEIVAVVSVLTRSGSLETSTKIILHSAAIATKPMKNINLWAMHLNHDSQYILGSLRKSTDSFSVIRNLSVTSLFYCDEK